MARDRHRDAPRHAGTHQVPRGRAAEVVHELGRHHHRPPLRVEHRGAGGVQLRPGEARLRTGGPPRLAEVHDRPALAVEHELDDTLGALGILHDARLPAMLEERDEIALDRQRAAAAVLGMLGPEPNHAAVAVDIGPGQREDLAAAPARKIAERRDVLQMCREVSEHGLVFCGLEESLPSIVLAKALDLKHARKVAAALGEAQRLPEQLRLAIHRRRLGALTSPRERIAVDGLGGQVADPPRPERLEDRARGLALLRRDSKMGADLDERAHTTELVIGHEPLASVARPPAARGRRTLTELAQGFLRWLDAHHRPQTTIASYGDGLGAFLTFATAVGMVYPDQVTVLSLDGYYVWLRSRGKAANTMAHRRSVLIAFWKWLEHEGFAERNVPAKTYPIKTPKRLPIYLEPHQIDAFLAKLGALTNLAGQRDHAVVATFFYSGVRVSELASLRVADVDLVGARIRVSLGKGSKDRILYVPPRLQPILAAYLAETRPQLVGRRMGRVVAPSRTRTKWSIDYWQDGRRHFQSARSEAEAHRLLEQLVPQPPDVGRLFVNAHPNSAHRRNPRGQSLLSRSWYYTIRNRARTLLGVKLSPHKLRHTCATYLLYHGAQLETIARLLGHSDVKTTMIYLHTPQKRQEEEIGRIFG